MGMKSVKQNVSRTNWVVFVAVAVLAAQLCVSIAWAEVPSPWKYAVLCDTRGDSNPDNLHKSGVNESVVNSVATDIVKEGAELVIVPGDTVNGWYQIQTPYADQFATWRKAMAPVYGAGLKVYPVRGNHEDGPFAAPGRYPWPPDVDATPESLPIPELKAAFLTAFSDSWIPSNGPADGKGLTYSFVYKNAFFVGLDQYVNPNRVNQPWLEEQLKQNKEPHVFVYGHAPAFRVNHTDSLASFPRERDAFWNSLGNGGVRIYFSGHDHFYNRSHIKDQSGHTIYQTLLGSGGAPFAKWVPHSYAEGDKIANDYHDEVHYGYVVVTVNGPRVMMEWKALFNETGQDVWKTMDILEYTVE
jgi:hypothetical protein